MKRGRLSPSSTIPNNNTNSSNSSSNNLPTNNGNSSSNNNTITYQPSSSSPPPLPPSTLLNSTSENNTTTRKRKEPRSSAAPPAASSSRLLELSEPLNERNPQESEEQRLQRQNRISAAMRELILCLGEDPTREGLMETPRRAAEAMLFWTQGYEQNLNEVVSGAIFEERHNEMVVITDVDVFSLCEHHLAPFSGKVHIGYIPKGRVLGLSKFARIIEMFARRLQIQERLTSQIADSIVEILDPQGVAVIIECVHSCMTSRGVQKPGAVTKTSCVRGVFKTDARTRNEFFSHVYGKTSC
jgi:GTP cyclohydrolase I